jgi:acetylornithine deacetylase
VVTWPGGQFASGRLDVAHPLVGEVQGAVAAVGGDAGAPGADVYGSDLRLYSGIGGIPTLHYGPGDPLLAHAPLEHIAIDELVQVTRALIVLTLRRCGPAV